MARLHVDNVASCACGGRHNGAVGAAERVEQAAFAHVGPPHDRHLRADVQVKEALPLAAAHTPGEPRMQSAAYPDVKSMSLTVRNQ